LQELKGEHYRVTRKSAALVACCAGLSAFFMVTRNHGFDALNVGEITLLMISGACFGVAAAAIYSLITKPHE
jgi:hypothetical protein